MILPNNGKVIIIDDQPEDVADLMFALTKEKMPFLFFTDRDGSDLPEDGPVENVRLVFLDLDLGIGGTDPIQKIRIIQGRLAKLLVPNTPYVLVIWSTHEDQYVQTLKDEFNNGFKDYSPITLCSLDKSEIKKRKDENVDVIKLIRDKLRSTMSSFSSFNVFLLWESIVNKSSGEISNGFSQIFKFDNKWDNNIKAFLFRLAKANVGEQKVLQLSNDDKLQIALETINSALIDSIEKNIKLKSAALNIDIQEEDAEITEDNLISINTKLHILHSKQLDHFQSGNIYIQSFYDEAKATEIVRNTFVKGKITEIISTKPTFIQVDVTPVCDYSQDKGYTRILTGLMVEGKYHADLKSSTPIFIYDLCPILNLWESYYLVFDFRYSKSFKKTHIEKYFDKPEYKIRAQLLADLQAGLSNHINRPGIVSID